MANTAHRPVFAISVCLVITATLSILLVGQLMSQSTSGSKSTKAPAGNSTQTPPLTPEEKEAQFHYKVALTALKNNDLEIAGSELEKAAKLAPNNALVQYNLAVVKSKNDKPAEALVHLKKAIEIGLPSAEAAQADDLLVQLTYQAQKTAAGKFSWLKGTWVANFDTRLTFAIPARNGLYNYCVYDMTVTSTLTVTSDVDHPDSLRGTLTYHAQGFGDVGSTYRKYSQPGVGLVEGVDSCLSTFGQPPTKVEDANAVITSISDGSAQNNSAGILMTGYTKSCGKYCDGWTYLPLCGAACTYTLSNNFTLPLYRVDDSQLEVLNTTAFLGDRGTRLKRRE